MQLELAWKYEVNNSRTSQFKTSTRLPWAASLLNFPSPPPPPPARPLVASNQALHVNWWARKEEIFEQQGCVCRRKAFPTPCSHIIISSFTGTGLLTWTLIRELAHRLSSRTKMVLTMLTRFFLTPHFFSTVWSVPGKRKSLTFSLNSTFLCTVVMRTPY